MKTIILLFAAITLTAATVNAQGATSFSIGLEGAVPMGDFNKAGYNFGIGGSAQVDHKVASDMALTLHVGYLNFSNPDSNPKIHFSVIPVLGIKFWFSPKVYGSGQLGAAFNSAKVSNSTGGSVTSTGFAYSPGIGLNISNNIDLLVKYFGNSVKGGSFSSIGARLAYTFGK